MAWTTPRDWVSSEVVTATIMNTHVRDNLKWLHGDAGGVTKTDQITPAGTQMRALRHPYNSDQHVETNVFSIPGVDTTGSASFTFADPFVGPIPVLSTLNDGMLPWVSAISGSGITVSVRDLIAQATVTVTVTMVCQGGD